MQRERLRVLMNALVQNAEGQVCRTLLPRGFGALGDLAFRVEALVVCHGPGGVGQRDGQEQEEESNDVIGQPDERLRRANGRTCMDQHEIGLWLR